MRQRTKAREIALQFLYQVDIRGREVLNQLEGFLKENSSSNPVSTYAREIILGCLDNWEDIDNRIKKIAKNWDIARIAVIDRTILRIAICELCHRTDIPSKVAINEAIELGKRFSTEGSGAFINGILDNLVKTKNKQQKQKGK